MHLPRRCLGALAAAVVVIAPSSLNGPLGTVHLLAGPASSVQVAPGQEFSVPIVLDMSAAGTLNVAALTTVASWNAARIRLDSVIAGAFGDVTSNVAGAAGGSASVALFSSEGATATTTTATLYYTTIGASGGTRVMLTPVDAGDEAGANLIPDLLPRSLDVCIATPGLWGEVNGDAVVNIIDAQQIARHSIGLTVANAAAVAARGDVTGDFAVNIIDAQQVARHSIGLAAAARIGTNAFTPPNVASLTMAPAGSLTIAANQALQLVATPRDAATVPVDGCAPVTWSTDAPAVATVNAAGFVTPVGPGVATITATSGAQSAQLNLSVIAAVAPQTVAAQSATSQSALAGLAVTQKPSVLVTGAESVPVPGARVTFVVTSGGGSVTGATVITGATGIATVGDWIMGATPGVNTLSAQVTAAGVTGNPISFSANSSPSGVAASIEILSGNNQVIWPGGEYRGRLVVKVSDGTGAPLANVPVTFSRGSAPNTNPQGITSILLTAPGGAPGADNVTATVAGLPSVTFNLSTIANDGYSHAHSCEIAGESEVYCWGWNGHGQLGDGTTINRATPTLVQSPVSILSLAKGQAAHTCGLAPVGEAYCWGANLYGQLGDGTFTTRTTPVPVSGGHTFTKLAVSSYATCGTTAAGEIYCWGFSNFSLVGDTLRGTRRPVPTRVGPPGRVYTEVAVGISHACALSDTGTPYCWGLNGSGEVGDGSTLDRGTPTLVHGNLSASSITVGNSQTCVSGGAAARAYCWGNGGYGLGDGTSANRHIPHAVSGNRTYTEVSATSTSLCGLTPEGTIYCWGENSGGLAGVADTTGMPRLEPTPVLQGSAIFTRFGSSGGSHRCALASSGQPYCWGHNNQHQLGTGVLNAIKASPTAVLWVQGLNETPASIVANSPTIVIGSIMLPTASASRPSVIVRDYSGTRPIVGATVTFTVTKGGGVVTGGEVSTDENGIATLGGSWTLGPLPGQNQLIAETPGVPPILFTATAMPPASMTVTVANPSLGINQWTFATAVPRNSESTIIPAPVTWSVQNPLIARIDDTGAIQALGSGSTNIVATLGGFSATAPITVTAASAAFNIELRGIGGLSASVQAAFSAAAARWMTVVRGDLSDQLLTELDVSACRGEPGGTTVLNETVDDVVIYVKAEAIDGNGGVLGSAAPCFSRAGGFQLPVVGSMSFDIADMEMLETTGRLSSVILHEMGHVLGIGTMWNGLVDGPASLGGIDPTFTGGAARAVFPAVIAGYGGAIVPVEGGMGPGSDDSHWRESVLARELMSPVLSPAGHPNPLSPLTLASLIDIGYLVDLSLADPVPWFTMDPGGAVGPTLLLREAPRPAPRRVGADGRPVP